MRLTVTVAALLLPLQLPAQDIAFWLDEIDLKAMTQRRGVPFARQAVGGGKIKVGDAPQACNRFATCGNSVTWEASRAVMQSTYRDTERSC